MAFFGGLALVDVVLTAPNQHISATVTADIGGDDPAFGLARNLFVAMCYQQQPGGSLVEDINYFGPLKAAPDTLSPFSITSSFNGLAPGTYTVGMCACADNADPTMAAWITGSIIEDVRVFQQ